MEDNDNSIPYCYFNPQIFIGLKSFLDIYPVFYFDEIDEKHISKEINSAMNSIEFSAFLSHAKQHCHSQSHFRKSFHEWFDAFKTLKFIRYLQVHHYPDIELDECIHAANELFV